MTDGGSEIGIRVEPIRAHAYDVDFKHCITLEILTRWFLEIAWNHAEALGVGFHHLAEQGKFWVLSRLVAEAQRYPRWGEELSLRTWPRTSSGLFAMRDFELVDAKEQVVVGCSSAWLVLDIKSRRPQRLDKVLGKLGKLPERRALAVDPQKLLPQAGTVSGTPFPVLYRDLDVNRHVGSAQYVGWLLNAYSEEFHHAHVASRFEINYVGETHGGDTMTVDTFETAPGEFVHSVRKAAGEEVCRARLQWRKND